MKKKLLSLVLILTSLAAQAAPPFAEFVDPNPNSGNLFGQQVVALSTGNVVVTSPFDDSGGNNAGAVYLFNGATGALISTLKGATANDQVGVGTVYALTNGNYVVCSPNWRNTGAVKAGAVTWGSGLTGVSGVVSAANSLVGTTTNDDIGANEVTVLSNGNYVVRSQNWDNGGTSNVGAVTWGNGTTGTSGVVGAANSLIGTTASDAVGGNGVRALSNGHYLVLSSLWNNGGATDAGAVTWCNGTTGLVGAVSAANSLVGSTVDDKMGQIAVTLLSNGHYVVRIPSWDNGGVSNVGAVTWCDGTTGRSGVISASNSLIGSKEADRVGNSSLIELSNGNYVVPTPAWDKGGVADAGAATWCDGNAGRTGVVSSSNSLIGDSESDSVGNVVTALTNGHYVVSSSQWSNGGTNFVGAVTWCNGTTGRTGSVSTSNSLVGTSFLDTVGNKITALSDGNYVVISDSWRLGGVTAAGAATWCNGSTGTVGTVSPGNSLVCSQSSDGTDMSVVPLSNGRYVVATPYWDNGLVENAGAVTWRPTGVSSGVVGSDISLVGTSENDQVGLGGAKVLTNGNYVVVSSGWDNGAVEGAGAVTWGDGAVGIVGPVSAANSLVGSTTYDSVGESSGNKLMVLSNGNYVVTSTYWDNGAAEDAGAVTWCDGSTGRSGVVSAANSLVGSTNNDQVGSGHDGAPTALSNGHYVVSSPNWDNGGTGNAGAVTWGNGTSGITGVVSAANSLVGSSANDQLGLDEVTEVNFSHYVVASSEWDHAAIADAGSVTWGRGNAGISGVINASNSLIGPSANSNLRPVVRDSVNGNYYAPFAGANRVLLGAQVDGLASPGPEISVTGLNIEIVNGDTTPSDTDNTDFGEVLISGAMVTHQFKILNTGAATLNLIGNAPNYVTLTGSSDFSLVLLPSSTVGVASSTTFSIRFDPSSVGPKSAVVTVSSDDGDEGIYTFVVAGTAPEPEIGLSGNGQEIASGDLTASLSDGTDFGSVGMNEGAVSQDFVIANTGNVILRLTDTEPDLVKLTGSSDFTVTAQPTTPVAAFVGTTNFSIAFDPSTPGVKTAVVSILNTDVDESPYTFTIQGRGRIADQESQAIVFTPPPVRYLVEGPLTLSASTSSGLPATFELVSGPATLEGDVLTFTGKGSVKVRALQVGNGDYLPAASVVKTIKVSLDPTKLTLANLVQTYTGTPRGVTVLAATEAAEVSYKVGTEYVSEPPTAAGKYSVKAVSGGTTKTGSLTISPAPLFAIPYDQRRLAGQLNPFLDFAYSGFLVGDTAEAAVSVEPTFTTKASVNSKGGLYPITGKGGKSANYAFTYLTGTMLVESFGGNYEALLRDGDELPNGKLILTVAANGKTFTGKLSTPTETAAVSLKGTLNTNISAETVTGSATAKKGLNVYTVAVTLPLKGAFTTEVNLGDVELGATTAGKKLLVLEKGQTLSYTGTHTVALLPPESAGVGVPAGNGWSSGTIDKKGTLKLVGKLGDGTSFTASLAADAEADPGYRLFVQPYKPARTGSFFAGEFALAEHPVLEGRRWVSLNVDTEMRWTKALRDKDTSYRAGFVDLASQLVLLPWQPPTKASKTVEAVTLNDRLWLPSDLSPLSVQYSSFTSESFAQLPSVLALEGTKGVISVSTPSENATKWKMSIKSATGLYSGSFELLDAGKKRKVTLTGVLLQPPVFEGIGSSVPVGVGQFLLPALPDAESNELLSGAMSVSVPSGSGSD